ncbi:cation diffusion facilitator family transporter [Verrucomicrobiaceae bacterium 227]
MNYSLVVAGILLVIKCAAAVLTGSSSIYSDAAESVGHFLAVAFAAWALRFAFKPADETHHFGHDKISYLSSGFEGAMIAAAALLILSQAVQQFIYGVEIHNLGIGIAITAIAAVVNLILGYSLVSIGRKTSSNLLLANGRHVLTDVWSSVAVLVALGLYWGTGWVWWDPIAATIAAFNILRVGSKLIRESLAGLLDESDPAIEARIRSLLDAETEKRELSYHNLRYRHSGLIHWIEFHLVFPDTLSVGAAHHEATEVESLVAELFHPDGRVISHLEPKSAEHHEEDWEAF